MIHASISINISRKSYVFDESNEKRNFIIISGPRFRFGARYLTKYILKLRINEVGEISGTVIYAIAFVRATNIFLWPESVDIKGAFSIESYPRITDVSN